jgi:hypothetical protein
MLRDLDAGGPAAAAPPATAAAALAATGGAGVVVGGAPPAAPPAALPAPLPLPLALPLPTVQEPGPHVPDPPLELADRDYVFVPVPAEVGGPARASVAVQRLRLHGPSDAGRRHQARRTPRSTPDVPLTPTHPSPHPRPRPRAPADGLWRLLAARRGAHHAVPAAHRPHAGRVQAGDAGARDHPRHLGAPPGVGGQGGAWIRHPHQGRQAAGCSAGMLCCRFSTRLTLSCAPTPALLFRRRSCRTTPRRSR